MKHLRTLSALGLVLAASALSAQESTGTIVGIVRDKGGKPMAGATVVATGVDVLGNRSFSSDAKGEFRISLLLPGRYVLKAYKDGYIGQEAPFSLVAGQVLRQEFALKLKGQAEAVVEVVAEASAVDRSATATTSGYTLDLLESLPLANRNALGALALAPGTGGNVIRGGMLGSAQATVNGIYIRDTTGVQPTVTQADLFVDDLVEDAAVVQSPLNAKYGNTSSGLLAVTTKVGTNDFRGSIRSKLSKSSWAAVSMPWPNRFNSVVPGSTGSLSSYAVSPANVNYTSDDLAKSYEVSLSGPIVKDRVTFIYGSRFSPDTSGVYNYGNILNSSVNTDWKTYLPGVNGITNGPTAGYLWGINPASPTLTPTASNSTHRDFNQYELYFQLAQDHQLKAGYSVQNIKTTGLSTNYNSSVIDTAVNNGGYDSRNEFRSLNYQGMVLGGQGIVTAKWGRRNTRATTLNSGPGDPVYVRGYTSTATNLLNTGSSQVGNYLTNGFAGASTPTSSAQETMALDFECYLGNHQVNIGIERVHDSQVAAFGMGPNNRAFYTLGRTASGSYLMSSFAGSLPSTVLGSGTAPVNPNTGKPLTQADLNTWLNGYNYIPEMVALDTTGGDPATHERTQSYYLNDLIKLGANFTLMGGIRMDYWRVDDRTGTRVSSHALSPRGEIKWDPNGDSRHLFSFSVADLRANFSSYTFGSYLRKGGNITRRYFWDQGSPVAYGVDLSAVLNPANYGYYYYYSNSDQLSDIDSTIKPDRTRQFELKYVRSFENGGSFRISGIYRKSYDMLTAWGYDQAVIMKDPGGSPVRTSAGAFSRLTRDPYGKRDLKSVEVEWSNPVYKSSALNVTWAGNYTFNRGLATTNFSEGNSSPVYYSVMAAQNIPLGLINPYGERQNNARHMLRSWVTVAIGEAKGIHHTFSLNGSYSTGQAISVSDRFYYPAGSFPNLQATSAAGYTVSYPTSFTAYVQGRGNRRDVDSYNFDLKWNMEIPIHGSLSFFLEAMVNNVFNIMKPIYDVGNTSTAWGYPTTTPTWNPAGGNSMAIPFTPGANTLYTFGAPWYTTNNPRSFSLDLGVRF